MAKPLLFLLVLFSSLFLYAYPSFALTVIDQPLDPSGYGFTSIFGNQNIVEDFTLSTESAITGVSWFGLFSNGIAATPQAIADFDILFYANDDEAEYVTSGGLIVTDVPETAPFYETTVSSVMGTATPYGDPLHGGTILEWEVEIPSLTFDADQYWISIRSNSTEADFFLWSHSANDDGYSVHRTLPTTYPYDPEEPFWGVSDEYYDEQAFALYATKVPEPSTAIFFIMGLVALTVLGRVNHKMRFVEC